MKNSVLTATVLASGVVLLIVSGAILAAEGIPPSSAVGNGSMSFGEDGDGVGLIEFEVERHGSRIDGSLLFAAEHHHDYPDIIVRADSVDQAEFTQQSVKFSGKGKLHETPVTIAVSASDGAGETEPDSFAITCTDSNGDVVFKAEGELSSGDIRIGEED